MTSEQEPSPITTDVLPAHFEFPASYIVGLIGLSIGVGFYGIIFLLLLIAWAFSAPSAPTATEGAAIYRAAVVHLFPFGLWLVYRKQISSLPNLWKWVMAAGAWVLLLATLTVMVVCLGV